MYALFEAVRDVAKHIEDRPAIDAAKVLLIDPIRDQKANAQYKQIARQLHLGKLHSFKLRGPHSSSVPNTLPLLGSQDGLAGKPSM